MAGYMFVLGACWSCKRTFTFNADWVPSIPIDGVREPICRECVERANPERVKNGLDPIVIHPQAYEAGEA